ncbi:lytic murein transglycosylase [compost metagenome]
MNTVYKVSREKQLDPLLVLAVIAIESRYNPLAESHVGAQGLMQVMTSVHTDKYENFGGKLAAFDPVTNLRVGVKVLKDAIARAGSVEGGLRHYVGAANLPSDGGYAAKVLAEHSRLRQAAGLRQTPAAPSQPLLTAKQTAPVTTATSAPVASAEQVALNTNL